MDKFTHTTKSAVNLIYNHKAAFGAMLKEDGITLIDCYHPKKGYITYVFESGEDLLAFQFRWMSKCTL